MLELTQKQAKQVVVQMIDIAGKIIIISIKDDSDCQSFYYLSAKARVFKNIVKNNMHIFYKDKKKTDLAVQVEGMYQILVFICTKKLEEIRKYLSRTMV